MAAFWAALGMAIKVVVILAQAGFTAWLLLTLLLDPDPNETPSE